jgi:hypothetical protein
VFTVPEWPKGYFRYYSFREIERLALFPALLTVVCFVVGWSLLLARVVRAAAVLAWVAVGVAGLLVFLVLVNRYSREFALTTRILPGAILWVTSLVVLTIGATRLDRDESRRRMEEDRTFWLTPWKVALFAGLLFVGAAFFAQFVEWRFNAWRWHMLRDGFVLLVVSLIVCFGIAWSVLLAGGFRAAMALAWVVVGLDLAAGFLLALHRDTREFAITTSLLLVEGPWFTGHLILAVGATRIHRDEYRRAGSIRAMMNEAHRIGDMHLTRPAVPTPTTIADRKAIDGTTQQG